MLLINRRRIVIGGILMRPIYSLLFACSLTIIPALHAEKIDNRNFAIDTCFPTPNEIQLAEGRTRAYWAKHAWRFGAEPRFLAVETSKIFPGEVQDLWPKLINHSFLVEISRTTIVPGQISSSRRCSGGVTAYQLTCGCWY